jgi:acylphosphatase
LRSCDFEIFGTVQRVYFRQHTQEQASKLKLTGWVKNTPRNTVQGHMEGRQSDVDQMKVWLQTTGSPKSRIMKAEFTNEKAITELNGKTFDIQR